MTFSFRPAIREQTPLIIGVAGPSKSGKTYSAHRLARGLAGGQPIVMINAEGKRGHQYADKFTYLACDIDAPYSYERYTEILLEAKKMNPGCVIVDSVSHAHDGPGGMIDQHDSDVERRAGNDYKKRERVTFAAWIQPKKDEGDFIYTLLGMACPVILCFRAKEKIKIVPGKDPIDLGYQPIASDRIGFETMFNLMLPPRSKGVPDMALSDMREPFDTFIRAGKPIDEELGRALSEWALGGKKTTPTQVPESATTGPANPSGERPASDVAYVTPDQVANLETLCQDNKIPLAAFRRAVQVESLQMILAEDYGPSLKWIERNARAGAPSGQP